MRLSFLGTGAATSRSRHNCAIVVDEELLFDGGAPLLMNLARLNVPADNVHSVLLTHCHGDHIAGLGAFLLARVVGSGPPLTIFGPPGTEARIDGLCRALWGERWRTTRGVCDLRYAIVAAGMSLRAGKYRIDVAHIEHDGGQFYDVPSVGYIISDGETSLGYMGDAAPGPWVDAFLERCEVAVIECTGFDPGPTHLSERYVAELARRHPATRLLLTHFGGDAPVIAGATAGEDFATFEFGSAAPTG